MSLATNEFLPSPTAIPKFQVTGNLLRAAVRTEMITYIPNPIKNASWIGAAPAASVCKSLFGGLLVLSLYCI